MNEFIWSLSIVIFVTSPVVIFGLAVGYISEKLIPKRINDLLGNDLHGRL